MSKNQSATPARVPPGSHPAGSCLRRSEVHFEDQPHKFWTANIGPSMDRAGSALGYAISESFVASLKTKILYRKPLSYSREWRSQGSVNENCPPNRHNPND